MPPATATSAYAAPANVGPASVSPISPVANQPTPGVSRADEVAVKNSLQQAGYSYADADMMAKTLLSVMEQKGSSGAGDTQALDATADSDPDSEGIALDPADGSEWTQSPVDKFTVGARASAASRFSKAPQSRFPTSPTAERRRSSSQSPRNRADLASHEPNSSGRTRPRTGMKVDTRDSRAAAPAKEDPSEMDDPNAWLVPVREAAEQLYAQLDDPDLPADLRSKYEVMLSLLLLAEEDPEQAVSALETFDDEELEFWRQTVLGLGTLLDTQSFPRQQDRVERATDFLNQGVRSLATLGRLQVRNLALCTKINGYGDFQECRPTDLKPDAPLLLYVEVENYLAEPLTSGRSQANWIADSKRRDETATGATKYATEFHGHYEIYDANQNRIVPEKQLPVARDECRNVRRDYFIPYQIYLPKRLPPGSYRLELTIEDNKSNKVGNAVLDFQVR